MRILCVQSHFAYKVILTVTKEYRNYYITLKTINGE